jgi:hypothetical protein
MASGASCTWISTAPQKQLPLCVIISKVSSFHVDDVFMRLSLPGFCVEQNDRAFASLDRASGFCFTPSQLLIEFLC